MPSATSSGDDEVRAGARLWRAVASGERDGIAQDAAQRFAALVSPALAEHVLGGNTIATDQAAHSRLNNRLNGGVQRRWAGEIGGLGIPVVYLKGFALAHTLYDDPDVRTIGDLDVLVRAADRDRLIAALADRGFNFQPQPRPPWGFISRASYMPFVSADGLCNLDIHIHPDCYPAYRSLTTELVFAAADAVHVGDTTIRVPDAGHSFLLCVTNAAKDKFGPYAIRKLVDAAMLVRRRRLDWNGLAALARAGRFWTPYAVVLTVLARLGVPAGRLPAPRRLPRRAAWALPGLVRAIEALDATEPGLGRTAWRELALCTEPLVGLHNLRLRTQGLVRPGRGIPENAPVQ